MMTKCANRFCTAIGVSAIALLSFAARGEDATNAYRGMFVCEQIPGAVDILHVPIDLAVRGDNVQFARPLFNLQGTRVLGSELGAGTIDTAGKLHITSEWYVRGIAVQGDYSGTLNSGGGTLSGTQSWRGPEGTARSRACHVALVPAPKATREDNRD
jgi:hypothetical protein